MPVRIDRVDYQCDGQIFEGQFVYDDSLTGPRPGVCIIHSALGVGEHESHRARLLAGMGYVAFIADLYGKGVHPATMEEAVDVARAMASAPGAFDNRVTGAMVQLRAFPLVDQQKTAAIGYCLGGRAVLNLARFGDPALGVVSFHGGLLPHPDRKAVSPMKTKVLIIHGWNDPYDAPDRVLAIGQELTEAKADWQIHAYGMTGHAFTDPFKPAVSEHLRYQPDQDRRSWQAMALFLEEVFAAD